MTETGAGIVVASNSWTKHTALARCEQEGIDKVVNARRLKSDRLPICAGWLRTGQSMRLWQPCTTKRC